MIDRYAWFWRTRGSRKGAISSIAVARRMIPFLCRFPSGSTYPFGRVNSNSVCNPSKRGLMGFFSALLRLLDPLQAFVSDLDLFEDDLVGVRVNRGC